MSEHPKDRPMETEDPFQVTAGRVSGDPALMLECLVEEFSRMSLSEAEILELFENPSFLATQALTRLFGPQETHRRVLEVLSRCKILRVRTTVSVPEGTFPCHRSHSDA